ncbi:MAG TPA: DUF481 domain-containing protein [Chryseosolibacter sp.]
MKIFFLIALLWFGCLTSTVTYAQFNDTTNYYVSLSSIGVANKTNDRESWLLNNNFKFSVYKKQISLNTSASMIYGEQNALLSNRDFIGALDFNYYLKDKPTYFWGLGTYEKNFSLKINNRLQTGLGVGYNVLQRERMVINISDGILYEHSDLPLTAEGQNIDYTTFRNSFRLKYRFIFNGILTFDGTDFIQHSLSDRSDYIIRTQNNLSLKLIRWLSITAGVTYNKLSKTGRENLLMNYGVTIERYF